MSRQPNEMAALTLHPGPGVRRGVGGTLPSSRIRARAVNAVDRRAVQNPDELSSNDFFRSECSYYHEGLCQFEVSPSVTVGSILA